ncbi:hypothetical protein NQ318_017569 [Aromia moschata]|uniref:Uncharacterized protein n=1 Tax=Aromia moschata TaxID=1265417 RepID=A0AAV8Z3K1_9CUCU|nr:hypothetical protein NQ318_017569 [Aromia moschata]
MFALVFVLQFREMVYLTEMQNITILQMIGYGDRTRTQAEVVRLFQEKYLELPPVPPFFIDGNLNGETYLALLQNNVVPTMANLYPAEGNPQLPCNAIWIQQDGALRSQCPAISPHNLSKWLDRETWFCRMACTIT